MNTTLISRRVAKAINILILAAPLLASFCWETGAGKSASGGEALNRELLSWPKLPPPQPGDWLYVHPEPAQSLEEYIKSRPNRKTPERHTIYIVPFGKVDEAHRLTLELMREHLAIYFDCGARLDEPLAIPERAYNRERHQYDASLLLEALKKRLQPDAIVCLGVIQEDIYVRDLNFVFGLASLAERMGVHSLFRYQFTYRTQPEGASPLLRALKVSAHEVGHAFGMKHCVEYVCNMNGSNSLPEMDRRWIHLCPICLRKLEWNVCFDRRARYEKLSAFYRKAGLKREAEFVARLAKDSRE